MPRRSVLATLLGALVCSIATRAQERNPDPSTAVLGVVAAAESALGRKQIEAAILALRDASERCAQLPAGTARDEIQSRIDALVSKADPVARSLALAERDAATKVVAVARMYEAKGWHRIALRYATAAEQLDAESARDLVQDLRDRVAAGAEPAAGSAFDAWFADGELSGAPSEIAVQDRSIRVQAFPEARNPVCFVSSRRARTRGIAMKVDVTATGDGGFGLVFAHQHMGDFHAVHVAPRGSTATLRVVRFKGENYETLGARQVAHTAGRMRLELRVTDASILVTAGAETLTCKHDGVPPYGFLGVTAWRIDDDAFRPTFEIVQVDATPHVPRLVRNPFAADAAESRSDAKSDDGATLAADLAALGSAIADEAAAERLHELRRRVREIPDAANRRRLQSIVDKLTPKLDPTDAESRKLLDAAARALLKPAQEYARRKWHVASLLPFERAADLSDAVGGKLLADARAAAGGAGKRTTATQDWLAGAKTLAGGGYWKVDEHGVESPKLTGESIGLRSERSTGREYSVAMAVRADASPSKAGILFAMKPHKDGDDYYVLELRHLGGHSQLRLLHIAADRTVDEVLLRDLCLTRAERAGFVDLSVTVAGDRIQVALGDLVASEVRAPTDDLSGCIGCFVSGDTPYLGTVRYRDLRVE